MHDISFMLKFVLHDVISSFDALALVLQNNPHTSRQYLGVLYTGNKLKGYNYQMFSLIEIKKPC